MTDTENPYFYCQACGWVGKNRASTNKCPACKEAVNALYEGPQVLKVDVAVLSAIKGLLSTALGKEGFMDPDVISTIIHKIMEIEAYQGVHVLLRGPSEILPEIDDL